MDFNQKIIISEDGTYRPNIDPNVDILIIPYFVSLGGKVFIRDQNTFRRIFDGMNQIILRPYAKNERLPLVKETPNNPSVVDADNLHREYFPENVLKVYGKLTNNLYANSFSENQLLSGIEQQIITTFGFIITSSFLWDHNLQKVNNAHMYSFFKIPELSKEDVYYISQAEVFLNGSTYSHTEITFQSCNDILRSAGRSLENFFVFSEPGMGELAFDVKNELIEAETGKFEVDIDGKIDKTKPIKVFKKQKVVEVDQEKLKNRPITSFQIEFSNLACLSSIMVTGRPIYWNSPNTIFQPRFLFFHRLLPLNTTYISPLLASTDDTYILAQRCLLQSQGWFNDWKDEAKDFADPRKEKQYRGVIAIKHDDIKEINLKKKDLAGADITNSVLANNDFSAKLDSALYYSPYSSNQIIYRKDFYIRNGRKIFYPTINETSFKSEGNTSLCNFLNFNFFNNDRRMPELKPEFLNFVNWGGLQDSIVSMLGIGAGAAFSVATGGTGFLGGFGGNFIANLLGGFLPKGWAVMSEDYNKGENENKFALLIPKRWYEAAKELIKDDKTATLPLELFEPNTNNTLAGLLNTSDYNTKFRFELTDNLVNGNTLDIVHGDLLLSGFESINTTTKADTILGYAIDTLQFQCLGGTTAVITFYDSNNKAVSQMTTNTNAVWSDNARKWTTTIRFSDWDGKYPNQMKAWNKSPALKETPEILTVGKDLTVANRQALITASGKIGDYQFSTKTYPSYSNFLAETTTARLNAQRDYRLQSVINDINNATINVQLTTPSKRLFTQLVAITGSFTFTYQIVLNLLGEQIVINKKQVFRNKNNKYWKEIPKIFNITKKITPWDRYVAIDFDQVWQDWQTHTITLDHDYDFYPDNYKLKLKTNTRHVIEGNNSFRSVNLFVTKGFNAVRYAASAGRCGAKSYGCDLRSAAGEFAFMEGKSAYNQHTILERFNVFNWEVANVANRRAVLIALEIKQNSGDQFVDLPWKNFNTTVQKTINSLNWTSNISKIMSIWDWFWIVGDQTSVYKYNNRNERKIPHFVRDFDYELNLQYKLELVPGNKKQIRVKVRWGFKRIGQIFFNNGNFWANRSALPAWDFPRQADQFIIYHQQQWDILSLEK